MKDDIRWLWNSSQGSRSGIAVSAVVGILRVCASLLFVWMCKQLIDIASHRVEGSITVYAVLLIVTTAIELLLSAGDNRMENLNNIRLENKLRHMLFSHLMASIWNGKERFHSGDVLNRIEEDVRLTAEALCRIIPSVLVVCFQMAAAFLFLTQLDSRMAWVMLFIMPIFLLTSKFYMKQMQRLTKEIRTTDSQIQSHMQEKIQHKILIQTLGQSETVISKLSFFHTILYGQTLKRINFTLFSGTLVMSGFATGYVLAFLWGVNGIYEGTVSFGVMVAFLQLVGQVQRPIVDLSRHISSLAQAVTSAARLKELNDVPLEEKGQQQIFDGKTGICLRNVSFSYPDGDRQVINDFSIDFIPGSRTAIVGETGVGKSTLVRLMLSLLHPQKGEIVIYNEKQAVEMSPFIRCNMVYVPQGNTLLSGTIRDNLLLGKPNATEEEFKNALATAAADFVYELPDSLDTLCGERGTGLSEGQAQRICIARGLLRPGNILLFDEFSSSLDTQTERLLMERLIMQAENKTLIFITHREMVAEYCEQKIRLERSNK